MAALEAGKAGEMRELILDPYLRQAGYDLCVDLTLLWAAGAIWRINSRWYRLFLGAALGGAYFFWLSLAQDGYLPGWPLFARSWASPFIHFLLMPGLMLPIAYSPRTKGRFAKLFLSFYAITLLTYGLAIMLRSFLALRHLVLSQFAFMLCQVALVLIVAELGWGAVHRLALERTGRLPLVMSFGGGSLKIEGMLDTGNRLWDPITRAPVVVIDFDLIRDLLGPEARLLVKALADSGELPAFPAEDWWCARIRVVPFHALGNRAGLLPAVRADWIRLGREPGICRHESILVAIETRGGLAGDKSVALVPPALWPPHGGRRRIGKKPGQDREGREKNGVVAD